MEAKVRIYFHGKLSGGYVEMETNNNLRILSALLQHFRDYCDNNGAHIALIFARMARHK